MRHNEYEGDGAYAFTFMVLAVLAAIAAFIVKRVVELHLEHSETLGPLLAVDGIALAVAAVAVAVGSSTVLAIAFVGYLTSLAVVHFALAAAEGAEAPELSLGGFDWW